MTSKLCSLRHGGCFGAVLPPRRCLAQTNRIAGVVRDETGGPIRGAIVRAETRGIDAPMTPDRRHRRPRPFHFRRLTVRRLDSSHSKRPGSIR